MHPVAAGGFASAAPTYARIRPAYARRAIGLLKATCPPGGKVVDLAAGTGILSGQLSRAGLAVTAVEPVEEMLHQLRRALPAVDAAMGVAEQLPLRDDSVDMIAVGQSFHWFDAEASLVEAHRVLRTGGTLALMWNVRDQSTPWVRELTELVESRTGGRPYVDHRERPWSGVVDSSGLFGEVRVESFPNPVPTTVQGVLDRVRSTSFVALLDEATRAGLLRDTAELLAGHPSLEGTFEYPHETQVHLCPVLDVTTAATRRTTPPR